MNYICLYKQQFKIFSNLKTKHKSTINSIFMKRLSNILFISLYSLLICGYSLAQPGALDLTFNPNDFGSGMGTGANDEVYTTVLQSNGKILIGGNFTSYNGVPRNGIARLNSDGSIDNSFDPGSGVSGVSSRVEAIAITPSGSILIGGSFTTYDGTPINNIVQLYPDGTIDMSFDPGTGTNNTVSVIVVKPNGKILIGGWFNSYNGTTQNRIAGLNADGSLDIFFLPGAGITGGYCISSIVQQGKGLNGKIIIGGWFTTYDGVTKNNIARLNSDGSLDNTFNSGTGTNDEVYSLAIQSDGKILVGGYFSTFNGSSRNGIARLNFNGNLDYSFNPGSGTGANSAVYSIIPLSNSEIIIAGSFITYDGVSQNSISRLNSNGTLDPFFNSGGGATRSVSLQSDGQFVIGGNFTSYDGIGQTRVTRISANGDLDTTFNPNSGGANDFVRAIGIQQNNQILLAGDFTTYDGSAKNNIARINPDGSVDPSFDPPSNGISSSDEIRVITPQNDGKVLIGGTFTSFNGSGNGTRNIARMNSDGTRDTTFNVGGTGANLQGPLSGGIIQIIVQPDGRILIGGVFSEYNGVSRNRIARLNSDGSLDTTFNPGADLTPVTLLSSNTYFSANIYLQPDGKILVYGVFEYSYNGDIKNSIIRLNPDGTYDPTFDSGLGVPYVPEHKKITSIGMQADSKIILAGSLISYDGVAVNNVCRINPDGSFDNTFDSGSGTDGGGSPIVVGLQADNKLIIRGGFTSYDGTPINRIARVNPDGTLDTSFDPGTGTGPSNSYSVWAAILQPDEKILIGGAFTSYDGTGRSRVARILRNCVSNNTGTDTHVSCGSFTWDNGNTYTSSNSTATRTLFDAAANGCDSVVTLDLTILPIAEHLISETACSSYTWTSGNGQTYTSSTIATDTIAGGAANGCDSIVTLDLTINQPSTGIDVISACDSYTWIDGINYTSNNNTATHTISGGSANGCDSIVTLDLTINQPTNGTDTQIACESFTWIDNNTYTQSNNTATHTIIGGNINGCDSIVTLDLTINQPTTGTDTQTACESFTWIDNNTYTQSNNTATHTITGGAVNGCDSTVSLNLTIIPEATGIDTQTACGSFTWIDNNTYTQSNNTTTHTIIGGATNGCDSVVTLDLTVININPTIIDSGDHLSVDFQTGDAYEWIDCENNQVIYTGMDFYPSGSGNYQVKVYKEGCIETSSCYYYSALGLEDNKNNKPFVIYPNPTRNILFIEGVNVKNIRILELSGKEVLVSKNMNQIDVSHLSKGLYLIEINNSEARLFSKL